MQNRRALVDLNGDFDKKKKKKFFGVEIILYYWYYYFLLLGKFEIWIS